ncbi:unnamed protein product, partial [Mesorhabditis spiculigera]
MNANHFLSFVILAILTLLSAAYPYEIPANYVEQREAKRFRGEPIRFGKRSPREPIRFGKRTPAEELEDFLY